MTTTSYDPRTGTAHEEVRESTTDEVEQTLRRASLVAPDVGGLAPTERGRWLRILADRLDDPSTAAELAALADRETALGRSRLTGEVARVAAQLRFYADVAEEGSWLGVTLAAATGTAPAIARMQAPLGPVAVFGASNFPFAFGVLGNDTAAALAAGCPVVAKAHPAHPVLSRRLAEIAVDALQEAGAPQGTFGLVAGYEAGSALVTSPHTAAVAFTGSQRGGLALWRLANEREVVIPVFAEMGTVNPVIVTPAGGRDMADVANGFVASFTLGSGQYCTKPGLLLAPACSGVAAAVGKALEEAHPAGWLLTADMARAATQGLEQLQAAGGHVVAQVPGPERGWAVPTTVLAVPAARLRRGSRLLEECFGPVALVAEYDTQEELFEVLSALQGALAASVMSGGVEDPDTGPLVRALAPLVGRVVVDGWPTGVTVSWAQQHGGPWPATSVPAATSVGAAALDRFTRPIAYQGVPDAALPPALQADNPWHLPRRVQGRLEASS